VAGRAGRDAQGFEEAFGYRIGFAAGQPPRPRGGVEALDRNHIGHAETGEGVAHIAFADEPADIRILCGQRFDRLALATLRVGDVVGQKRTRDLHLDRPGKGP
jgi:hypothetical protein